MLNIDLGKKISKAGIFIVCTLTALLCVYSIVNYRENNTTKLKFDFSAANESRSSQNKSSIIPKENIEKIIGSRNKINNNHKVLFYTYSGGFLLFVLGAIYVLVKKSITIKLNKNQAMIMTMIFLIALFLKLYAATLFEGFSTDIALFKNWAIMASEGLSNVYLKGRSSDYPPLYMYILSLIGKISAVSSLNNYFTVLLKIPSIFADIATGFLIYKMAKKKISNEAGLILAMIYIFNPVTFINSSIWGQVDSFFTLLIVIGVYMLSEGKVKLSTMIFTCAVLMKPQGIIFIPVVFFELVRRKKFKDFIKCIVIAIITAIIIILPFSLHQNFLWIFNLYSKTISEYPYASVNGFNFFSLFGGNYKKVTEIFFIFTYKVWGIIFILAVTLFSWYIYNKEKSSKYAFLAALIQIFGVFTFSTGMHERYLFPAVALSLLAYIYTKNKSLLLVFVGSSLTVLINTYEVMFGESIGGRLSTADLILVVISLLNVLLSIYLGGVWLKDINNKKLSI